MLGVTRKPIDGSKKRSDEDAIPAPVLCCPDFGWSAWIYMFRRRARPLFLHRIRRPRLAAHAGGLQRFVSSGQGSSGQHPPRGRPRGAAPGPARGDQNTGGRQYPVLPGPLLRGTHSGGSYLYRLETGKPASGGKKGVTGRRRGDRLEASSSRLPGVGRGPADSRNAREVPSTAGPCGCGGEVATRRPGRPA